MEKEEKKRGKPFEEGNPGRPVGAVNKTTKMVKEWFAETFDHLQNDEGAKKNRADLKQWAEDNPTEFYKLSSKLIPVQFTGDADNPIPVNIVENLSFDQLYQLKYGTKPE